jgi:hypothetical protein
VFVWSFSLFAYLKTTLYLIPLITFCSCSLLQFATFLIEVHLISLSNILHLTILTLFLFEPMTKNYRVFVVLLGFFLDLIFMRILNSVILRLLFKHLTIKCLIDFFSRELFL